MEKVLQDDDAQVTMHAKKQFALGCTETPISCERAWKPFDKPLP
jgi:hypothetical protein